MKRRVTEQEEHAYRLTSCNFRGLPIEAVAKKMGITVRRVQQLLRSVKQKAPQLFERPPFIPRGKVMAYNPSMDESVTRKF